MRPRLLKTFKDLETSGLDDVQHALSGRRHLLVLDKVQVTRQSAPCNVCP